jgi:hypothetical protein
MQNSEPLRTQANLLRCLVDFFGLESSGSEDSSLKLSLPVLRRRGGGIDDVIL